MAMRPGTFIPTVVGLVALGAAAVPIGGLLTLGGIAGAGADATAQINLLVSLAFAVAMAAAGLGWLALHIYLIRPVETLATEAQSLAGTTQLRAFAQPRQHALGRLPGAVEGLAKRLVATRGQVTSAVAEATQRAEEQKSRLEAILLDLTEGVVVCNLEHRILLYNQAAARILGSRDTLGLGRPLFGLLTNEPVLHTLEHLTRHRTVAGRDAGMVDEPAGEGGTRRFVCATVDLGTLLDARISLVREPSGEASGYVLSFADVGAELEDLTARDLILREVMVDWRRPLANIQAAVETLEQVEAASLEERAAFDEIVRKEVAALAQRFAEASRRYDRLAAGPWPLADIHTLDLFNAARKHLAEVDRIELTLVGVPLWIAADSHSLLLAIEHLVRVLARHSGLVQFDIEAVRGESRAYLEIAWTGAPIPSAVLESWLDVPLPGTIASRTVRQIVERHGSELWSRARVDGTAAVRLPLQLADRPPVPTAARPAPRPEYYDFDLFRIESTALADTPLRKMRFVVFDTETTGLRPSDGDEMISIGAVRVVNGRILTGETFERLIDPGRPIPAVSIKIHGITEDMVKGKPPARIVLPQFKAFAGDAVLIAYNIAFDMKFLEMKEEQAGVRFDNPVLDALLLSIWADKDAPDHSLNGMADRLGLEVIGRHTALGDAMTTAALWVRLLDLLEARGVTTFGEAVRISSRMLDERKLSAKF